MPLYDRLRSCSALRSCSSVMLFGHALRACSSALLFGRAVPKRKTGSTTNPVREVNKSLDLQQTGRAANRTSSVLDPFPLTAMRIGLLGLDRLRNPLLTAAFRPIRGIRHLIRESHPCQKCEDCEPRIKRIARIRRDFKILHPAP